MDGKYIFAIIVAGIFFLLIIIAFAVWEYERKKQAKLQAWIDARNANSKVNKPDYDTDTSDADISFRAMQTNSDGNGGEDDGGEPVQLSLDDTYGKIDVEGIEEITGNYDGK